MQEVPGGIGILQGAVPEVLFEGFQRDQEEQDDRGAAAVRRGASEQKAGMHRVQQAKGDKEGGQVQQMLHRGEAQRSAKETILEC